MLAIVAHAFAKSFEDRLNMPDYRGMWSKICGTCGVMHIAVNVAVKNTYPFRPSPWQVCGRWLCLAALMLATLLLSACDAGDLETAESRALIDFRENSTGKVDLEVLELFPTEDGTGTEVLILYTLTDISPANLPPGTSLIITIVDENGDTLVVTDEIPLGPGNGTGEVQLVTPGENAEVAAVAVLAVEDPETDVQLETETVGVLDIDLSNAVRPSDIFAIEDFSLELVENSYESSIVDQRRQHRFTVRAYDQECVSIRGLSEDVDEYFTLFENFFVDVESPVEYDSRNSFIRVYFVLDASSSVTDNDRQQLVNAARYASDRMRDDYVVDFRQFSGDIQHLDSFRDYQPDSGQSATAFYYAIDTVLEEIEERGPTDDYYVIIGFTDGVDLASRNHFGQDLSNEAIQTMIRDKVQQFRTAPNFTRGSGLELHLLSVGNVVEQQPALNALAQAGGGQHVFASDRSALEPLLESLVNNILATYHLEYSSQQQADDSDLLLEVTINDITKPLQIRNIGGFDPVHVPHACQQP